jgi:hypothetical protein
VSLAAITLCVAFRRVFIVVVYFVIDPMRKLLDTPLYIEVWHGSSQLFKMEAQMVLSNMPPQLSHAAFQIRRT